MSKQWQNNGKFNKINVRLVNNARDYKISKPSFTEMFSKDLVAIHVIKPLKKPIYAGFSILDLSKLFMRDFHYNYIKKKYNFYKEKDSFDFSDYPKDSKCFDLSNKKEIGKMKDESLLLFLF